MFYTSHLVPLQYYKIMLKYEFTVSGIPTMKKNKQAYNGNGINTSYLNTTWARQRANPKKKKNENIQANFLANRKAGYQL